jgi:hypothetical protein
MDLGDNLTLSLKFIYTKNQFLAIGTKYAFVFMKLLTFETRNLTL